MPKHSVQKLYGINVKVKSYMFTGFSFPDYKSLSVDLFLSSSVLNGF